MGYTLTLLCLLLAACAVPPAPTVTPTHALSGPTLQASPTINPAPFPTQVPGEDYFSSYLDPTAAGLPPGAQLPPAALETPLPGQNFTEIVLDAQDGTLLFGDLYQQPERVPGVLLLARNRFDWGDLAEQLFLAGFTVLTMDIRAAAGLGDFRVMLEALSSGVADPGRLAVIGGGEGADLALIGCAAERLCDAAALLSPRGRDTLLNLMPDYNPRPLLLAASEEDAEAFATIEALQAAAAGEVQYQPFANAGSGALIVQNRPDMLGLLLGWVQRVMLTAA
ncbi:MAG: hypothetical protein HXY40_07900 [Chloroflexi bacterium]|nr:hypothetical protein [Chloroflexota bacterium]